MRIDLHTHSTASDGIYPPAELVRLAHEAGLEVLGLVDHDTTDGLDEAIEAGAGLGVTVVPGVEVNTELPEHKGDVHVLGYYVEYTRPDFQASLHMLRDARVRRGERMAQLVVAPVMRVRWQDSAELAGTARGADGFGSTGEAAR